MSARLVIAGADGLVGRALTAAARARGDAVLACGSADWDITDPDAAPANLSRGDVVVNCAAYTAVDAAEADPDAAQRVNAHGAAHVARACAAVGAGLIHLSTDYVFGGVTQRRPFEIDDATAPVSVYGRTKLAGEHAVLETLPAAFVVRTAWVYAGDRGADFVTAMRDKARAGEDVDVVADQIGSPTFVGDLVAALLQIADGGVAGPLLHAAGGGEASRYDQACAVYRLLGADPARVRPVGSDAHPRPAPRPTYSALAARRSVAAGLRPLRDWRAALEAALRTA